MKRLLSLKSAVVLCAGAAAAFSLWLLALPAGSPADARIVRSSAMSSITRADQAPPGQGRRLFGSVRDTPERARAAADGIRLSKTTTAGAVTVGREKFDGNNVVSDAADADRPSHKSMLAFPGTAAGNRRNSVSGARPVPAVLPLAFQEEEPGTVFTAPAHAAAAVEVQDQFIEDIGGEAADPSTPAYRHRWPSAQRIADQRLRARIGAQAFASYQREAYLRSRQQQAHP